jgi:hypothetical protein
MQYLLISNANMYNSFSIRKYLRKHTRMTLNLGICCGKQFAYV